MNSKRKSSGAPLGDAVLKSRRGFLLKGALGAAALPLAARMAACNSTPPADNPDLGGGTPDLATPGITYSSADVQIVAFGYQVEKQASATYVTAAGLNKLVDPFLSIALQFKADHDANAAVFQNLYNTVKTASDPALVDPGKDLTGVFPPKSTYPLTTDTNILIYALGLELLAAQVYGSLASATGSDGMAKFAAVFKVAPTLSITRTNLAAIAAATDVAANEMQHAMALRAALVLFKAQNATAFILSSAGTKTGNPPDFDPAIPANLPNFFGPEVTAQNPSDYLA